MTDLERKLEADYNILMEFVIRMNSIGLYGKYSIKGNMLLHYLQYEQLKSKDVEYLRYTKDIDMAMKDFSDLHIRELLMSKLKGMKIYGNNVDDVVLKKEPVNGRSSWMVQCYTRTNTRIIEKVLRLDINCKGFHNDDVTIYKIGCEEFYGSTIDKIVTDKLTAISSRYIKNRSKDLYDMIILKDFEYDTYKVASSLFNSESYGDFEYFLENKDEIMNYLGKLRVYTEIDVEYIYTEVLKIVRVFLALRGPLTGVWGDLL